MTAEGQPGDECGCSEEGREGEGGWSRSRPRRSWGRSSAYTGSCRPSSGLTSQVGSIAQPQMESRSGAESPRAARNSHRSSSLCPGCPPRGNSEPCPPRHEAGGGEPEIPTLRSLPPARAFRGRAAGAALRTVGFDGPARGIDTAGSFSRGEEVCLRRFQGSLGCKPLFFIPPAGYVA